jgi:hypothetical protein
MGVTRCLGVEALLVQLIRAETSRDKADRLVVWRPFAVRVA